MWLELDTRRGKQLLKPRFVFWGHEIMLIGVMEKKMATIVLYRDTTGKIETTVW